MGIRPLALISSRTALRGPLGAMLCAHTNTTHGVTGRHDLRLASGSQLQPCTELAVPPWATGAQRGGWHRLPLPQAPYEGTGGQAGTQSPLFSTPLPGTDSPTSSRGIIHGPKPSAWPGGY